MASITQFKAALTNGGARSNQFRVGLSIPDAAYRRSTRKAMQKCEFLCIASSIPEIVLTTTSVAYYGRNVTFPADRIFNAWRVTIANDSDFTLYNEIESWMMYINNVKTSNGTTNPLLYSSDLSVTQLDRNNKDLKSFRIVDAWPRRISAIDLDFNANNKIQTFDVDFEYSWFETEQESTISASVGDVNLG